MQTQTYIGERIDSRRAWAVTAAAFVTMLVSVGTAFSGGTFAPPIARNLEVSAAAVTSAFSVTTFVFFASGAVSGPAVDRLGPRPVLLLGAMAYGAGLWTSAGAHSLVGVYVGLGLGLGLSAAAAFVPLVAVVSGWFDRRRSLALGVTVSGIGVGTLAVAPLSAYLVDAFGWRYASRVMGVSGTLLLVACALVVARPPRSRTATPPVSEALRTRDYRLLYLAQLLLAAAMFIPFAHLPAFAEHNGVDPVAAAALVGAMGGASLVGRLALGPVADRFGLLRTYRGCFLAVALSYLPWLLFGESYGALGLQAIVFGIGYGGFVALGPGILAERFGVARMGGLLGLLYTSSAVGASLGPFVAGLAIDHVGYQPAIIGGLAAGLLSVAVLGAVTHAEVDPAS